MATCMSTTHPSFQQLACLFSGLRFQTRGALSGCSICNRSTWPVSSSTSFITRRQACSRVSPKKTFGSTYEFLKTAAMAATNSTWENLFPGQTLTPSAYAMKVPLRISLKRSSSIESLCDGCSIQREGFHSMLSLPQNFGCVWTATLFGINRQFLGRT